MIQALLIIGGIVGAAVIAAVSTQFLHTTTQAEPSASPEASSTPQQSTSPLPTESPLATPSPQGTVQGIRSSVQTSFLSTQTPTSRPSPSPKPISQQPRMTSTPTSSQSSPSIEFISKPSKVSAGESFQISWRVNGPEGAKGSDATLKATHRYESNSNGSSVKSSTNNSNSYGSFTVPKTFSSTFSFGVPNGEVLFDLTATVNGQQLHESFTVKIE